MQLRVLAVTPNHLFQDIKYLFPDNSSRPVGIFMILAESNNIEAKYVKEQVHDLLHYDFIESIQCNNSLAFNFR